MFKGFLIDGYKFKLTIGGGGMLITWYY